MKKKLNTTSLLEEFQQDSEFFKRAKAPAPHPDTTPSPTVANVPGESIQEPVRTAERTHAHRDIKRHAFEFYRDQLDALKQLAFEDVRTKGQGNMSSMVRDALDDYLAKRGITPPTK